MLDALTGFVVVSVAILVGWVIGRVRLLGPHARDVLMRLSFFVLSPFLLFVVLARADAGMLFSSLLPVSAIAAVSVFAIHTVVARLVWRRPVGITTIGALSSGHVNANNIGLPLSLYLLGSAAYPAPVVLMQLLVFTPVSLTILDAVTSERTSLRRTVVRTATNPIIIGSLLGAIVSVLGIPVPELVMEPVQLIANAAVPVLLISYGMSLPGQRVLGSRGHRRDIVLATTLKIVVMPVIAWAAAEFLFRLPPEQVLIVTVLAALPTAQNIFNFSQRYDIGEEISRDAVLLTTIGCLPAMLLIVTLLG
ncbi:AEC family transporter [uncultured Microbacterium sp.]|jgi:predicted permease|uniref:AEC family transporter n=1 Tax=uncultured Microbacterium sp. TaxID=191216 RepID=UPI00261D7B45|nr:AEC family transporter [uncultured Microbacterium sp.]